MAKKSKHSTDTNVEIGGPMIYDKSKNILISIFVKPGAKQNMITDISREGVGVQVNAQPVDGKSNAELIRYLASVLDVKKGDITIEKGHKSRLKILRISCDISIETAEQRIRSQMKT